jgi:hypothetical protein
MIETPSQRPSRGLQASSSSIHLPSESPVSTKLRELYQTAANAFLRRDFGLTHELIQRALELLPPPVSPDPLADGLSQHRRKWTILSVTLITTVHGLSSKGLPESLREDAALPLWKLLELLHARSTRLFTPSPFNPNPAWLPAPIVYTLVLAALKFEIPDCGKNIIEEWLARRTPGPPGQAQDGYDKLLELYCVHVLPRLDDWEYAEEFLKYETELLPTKREVCVLWLSLFWMMSLIRTTDCHVRPFSSACEASGCSGSPFSVNAIHLFHFFECSHKLHVYGTTFTIVHLSVSIARSIHRLISDCSPSSSRHQLSHTIVIFNTLCNTQASYSVYFSRYPCPWSHTCPCLTPTKGPTTRRRHSRAVD